MGAHRLLGVGRVATAGAGDHRILAGKRGQDKLVGIFPADSPAVGFRHKYRQTAPAIDVAVGLGHSLIALLQALLVGVKAIGVLHGKFPYSHQARPGPELVPEFGLNLIQDHRQVPVALEIGPGDVGDYFFMGRGQNHRTPAAILQRKQIVPEGCPATGLLPQLHGLQGGQEQFLAAGGIHLFPNDAFNLADRAPG